MARVSGFYRIIENHVLAHVSCKIDMSELSAIRRKFYIPGTVIDWGNYGNPYFVAFRCLLDMFHLRRTEMAEVLPLQEKIDFYFDNQSEKRVIIAMWEKYISTRSDDARQHYGATPRFENDEEFLPLQAADFWAWWVRKWYVEGTPEKIDRCDFEIFSETREKRNHKLLKLRISFDQEQLLVTMRRLLRAEIGPGRMIYEF